MRIAVTTSNGEKVDQHFGKATRFDVYEMDDQNMQLIESREVKAYCGANDGEPVDSDHQFSLDRFSAVQQKLNDCEKLYTLQIGEKPKSQFHSMGIAVQTCSCPVSKIPGCSGNCK